LYQRLYQSTFSVVLSFLRVYLTISAEKYFRALSFSFTFVIEQLF
jgi:hypothetical protein